MLTILAHWFDARDPNLAPLFYDLVLDRRDKPTAVIFFDGLGVAREKVLAELRRYRSCFPWRYVAPDPAGEPLESLLVGDVLELPASAHPADAAVRKLDRPFAGHCYAPSAALAFLFNGTCSCVRAGDLADCELTGAVAAYCPADAYPAGDLSSTATAPFVAYPPPLTDRRPRPTDLVRVLEESL